jgi:sugar-specific transcriptional regulator TrmB
MQELLEALGLNGYEARALAHLLRHGERTGPDLSREASIPFGRVYETLNGLVERGLAASRGGRPRLFAACAASAVPGRLLATGKRRLQEEERILSQHAAGLESELARLAPRNAPGSTLYGVRLGEDAAREFLVEATHEARERVDAYLAFEHIQDDDLAIFDAFRQAVGRGVKTRVLLRARDVDYLLTTPYVNQVLEATLPHLGENLQVRLSKTDIVPFSLLDGERVVLGVKNPLDPRTYFAVVHLDDRAFAKDLAGKFETLWRQGEFNEELVASLLRRKGGKALLRLGARMKAHARVRRAPPQGV